MPSLSRERSHEDSQSRALLNFEDSDATSFPSLSEFDDLFAFPSFLFPLRAPVLGARLIAAFCLFVSCPSYSSALSNLVPRFSPAPDQGRQLACASQASLAPLPRGVAALHRAATFSRLVAGQCSTQPAFWHLLTPMLSRTSSLSSPVIRQRQASPTVIQTLAQRPQRERATPNHALQRTAPRVTVAAIHVRSRLFRAGRCSTSVASFFAPPSQLPRRAPQSLSLGSLGAFDRP